MKKIYFVTDEYTNGAKRENFARFDNLDDAIKNAKEKADNAVGNACETYGGMRMYDTAVEEINKICYVVNEIDEDIADCKTLADFENALEEQIERVGEWWETVAFSVYGESVDLTHHGWAYENGTIVRIVRPYDDEESD